MESEHLPLPGSPAATAAGCRCEVYARRHVPGGAWIPLWHSAGCPLHARAPEPAGYQDVAEPLEETSP